MLVREKTALPVRRADTEGKKPGRSKYMLLFPGFYSVCIVFATSAAFCVIYIITSLYHLKGAENGVRTEEKQPDRMDLSDSGRPHRDRMGILHEAVIRVHSTAADTGHRIFPCAELFHAGARYT